MLKSIRSIFESFDTHPADQSLSTDQRQLACAALLLEVANADKSLDDNELRTLHEVLKRKFDLSMQELNELMALANDEQDKATSLYQFTQLVNQHCSQEEKYQLILGMWDVAYADGDLDKYEEHLIRKVAELIHVSHSDFIRAKLAIKNN